MVSSKSKNRDYGNGNGNGDGGDSSAKIKPMAKEFFQWLHNHNHNQHQHKQSRTYKEEEDKEEEEEELNLLTGVDRGKVGELFHTFILQSVSSVSSKKQLKRNESLVMASLRYQKLMKTKRYADESSGTGSGNGSGNGSGSSVSSGSVICVFANPTNGLSFAPIQERQTQRQIIRQQRIDLHDDKEGITIDDVPITYPHKGPVMPMNEDVIIEYTISIDNNDNFPFDNNNNNNNNNKHHQKTLLKSILLTGSHKKYFTLISKQSIYLTPKQPTTKIQLKFRPTGTAAYRASIICTFIQQKDVRHGGGGRGRGRGGGRGGRGRGRGGKPPKNNGGGTTKSFSIMRSILLRSGDADMYDALKPKSPYNKKKIKRKKDGDEPRIKKEDIVPPPKQHSSNTGSGSGSGYNGLGHFRIPKDVRELVETKEMAGSIVSPFAKYTTNEIQHMMANLVLQDDDDDSENEDEEFSNLYINYWQNLLWTMELQAYDDIQLFDMDNVALQHHGGKRYFKLYVSGLAEGRPSVLRGDIVKCIWKSKQYIGRVYTIEQLNVILEFDKSFHQNFNVNLDRIEHIRFTFGRTPFRTAHAGIVAAPQTMSRSMLMPTTDTFYQQVRNERSNCPTTESGFRWTSPTTSLNAEQKQAVHEIVKGTYRPMPYIIFGPPGTGKTTTMVEAVYQLANLHTYKNNSKKKKILLIAPSNDATDILVEKLAPYFPPSEMIRVLAFTRSIDQVSEGARPYCEEGLQAKSLIQKIMNCQITVATVNMAARLWCTGGNNKKNNGPGDCIPKGYFDVLCVDEAGHATEPEVIAVAATLMNFHKDNNNNDDPGQIVLAGDPQQLGPIITSELCKKFKMDQSYMERLIKTCPPYMLESNNNKYRHELVTLLVNNYRSHPDILKLPNEMFYRNELKPRGDKFTTHSMTKWEHLPVPNFPIIFHAVDGENSREGSSPSWFNIEESMVVVDYVNNLVKHSKPKISQHDIGIITPYARQVQKIRIGLKLADVGDVKVGSVETFQGQERRVIIISTVRSQNDLLVHDKKYNLGFVSNEKRFNVAITRAKALLIVVGNPRVLATDEKNWLPLLRFCRDKKSWLGEEWDEGASSDDEDEAFDVINSDDIGDDEDEDEWAVVAQEPHGFINREE